MRRSIPTRAVPAMAGVLAGALQGASCGPPAQLAGAPVAADAVLVPLDGWHHDLGAVAHGARIEHDFRFLVQGVDPIEIDRVDADCSCHSAGLLDPVLEPGEEGVLRVELQALSAAPEFRSAFALRAAGRVLGTFTLSGAISDLARAWAEPELAQLRAGGDEAFEFALVTSAPAGVPHPEPVALRLGAGVDPLPFEVGEPQRSGSEGDLVRRVRCDLPALTDEDVLLVECRRADGGELRVRLALRPDPGALAPVPEHLFTGILRAGEPRSFELPLAPSGGALEARASADWILPELRAAGAEAGGRLVVGVRPPSDIGVFRETIELLGPAGSLGALVLEGAVR